ncbi:hypothetical protein EDB89DRAFT_1844864 [Lactarius sanguifluus]|nr:hypothetical protein EDB89DRAFT_1844864 [Lactarius sanguifluus]
MAPSNTNITHDDDTPYLDALLDAVPDDAIPLDLKTASTSHSVPKFVDAALRLASGGSSRQDDDARLRDAWPQIQASLQHALHALGSPPAHAKRKRSPSPSPAQAPPTNKKSKHEEEEDGEEDPPHLTLHALSATAPVRHKVDITLHTRSLRLAHATTGALVARCARAALTRGFLLPTRARATGAPQWTALLLAGDTPMPAPSAASRKNNGAGAGAVPHLTSHRSTSTSVVSTSASSSSSLLPTPSTPHQALLSLLSPLSTSTPTMGTGTYPAPKLVQIERGARLAGITAFRGARETSLWFLDGAGILADTRPAEFWALADLAQGDAGVRVLSATGRTCTVILTRCPPPHTTEGSEEDDEGEETEFQMIDGKEREGIMEWVWKHKSAFGIAVAQRAGAGASTEGGVVARGDSDSDSDFEQESGGSDDGSPSSSGSGSNPSQQEGSEGSGNESGADDGAEGSAEAENDDDEGDDEEIVELDPKRHPLLRAAAAGAIPKMSRAAVDAAVGLVVDDLVGRGPGGPGLPLPPIHDRHRHRHEDDGESEEDELED